MVEAEQEEVSEGDRECDGDRDSGEEEREETEAEEDDENDCAFDWTCGDTLSFVALLSLSSVLAVPRHGRRRRSKAVCQCVIAVEAVLSHPWCEPCPLTFGLPCPDPGPGRGSNGVVLVGVVITHTFSLPASVPVAVVSACTSFSVTVADGCIYECGCGYGRVDNIVGLSESLFDSDSDVVVFVGVFVAVATGGGDDDDDDDDDIPACSRYCCWSGLRDDVTEDNDNEENWMSLSLMLLLVFSRFSPYFRIGDASTTATVLVVDKIVHTRCFHGVCGVE